MFLLPLSCSGSDYLFQQFSRLTLSWLVCNDMSSSSFRNNHYYLCFFSLTITEDGSKISSEIQSNRSERMVLARDWTRISGLDISSTSHLQSRWDFREEKKEQEPFMDLCNGRFKKQNSSSHCTYGYIFASPQLLFCRTKMQLLDN